LSNKSVQHKIGKLVEIKLILLKRKEKKNIWRSLWIDMFKLFFIFYFYYLWTYLFRLFFSY